MKQLIIIPTPIGNLSDVSQNIVNALSSVDTLLCESIQGPKKLYQLLNIPCPRLVRYWQKTEERVVASLEQLEGDMIGLVSDAGMPCISDPGYGVVSAWHEKEWPVTIVSGPSAVPMAIALSGLPVDAFQFLGFLPSGGKKRVETLETIKQSGVTTVLYESPRRIVLLCQEVLEVFSEDHLIFVAKELTKKHEAYYRGTPSEVITMLGKSELKGEFVMVISRAKPVPVWQKDASILMEFLSVGDAATAIAKIHACSRSNVYQYLLSIR